MVKVLTKKNKMKKINENQKVTLTIGQLKRLVRESKEWKSRWSAIDGHPDGGEFEEYFDGTCDRCLGSFDSEDRLHTLYGWFTNHDSIGREKEAWNRVESMVAKMDDDANEEFMSELDDDNYDYCEDCAIDILEELAEKYIK